jgi:hypothetical protein
MAPIGPLGATDEQSKALGKLADFGTTVVTEVGKLAGYVGRIIGTGPEDVVGLVLGDPLHTVRTLAAGWYDSKVQEILERRKVRQTQPVSLSVAIPLLRGAYDESREGLRDLWAQLIAAAMDPDRADRVRVSFAETLRQFDPLDALVLRAMQEGGGAGIASAMAPLLGCTVDDIVISFGNLEALRCARLPTADPANAVVLAYGRGLLVACSD